MLDADRRIAAAAGDLRSRRRRRCRNQRRRGEGSELDESREAHNIAGVGAVSRLGLGRREKEFRRAVEVNAGYATAHLWYGEYLMARGVHDRRNETRPVT